MLKRKEFILGAAVGLTFAAAATAGGVIQWPQANAQTPAASSGRLIPTAGAAGLAFAPPQGAPLSFADIFDQVSPAVVQIDVESRVRTPQGVFQIPGLPFGFRAPEPEEGEEAPTQQGAGSGFFISADGYIVTNNHVVADATAITVKLADGRELEATLVGRDAATDLAVIKVEGGTFPFVNFEESAEPRVGDWVIAVGNPFGLGGTATAGIVSARARDIGDARTPYTDYLQIDAAINRGNSGGPTFDIYGRVIGVNSAIFSPTGGSVGIGFAIPASVAKPITDRLIRGEAIQRGYLGVEIGSLSDDQREALGLADDAGGAYINNVTAGAPAAEGGLRAGDIVVELNGEAIEGSNELTRLVGGAAPGDSLRLVILRDNRRQTLNIRAGARPADLGTVVEGEEGTDETPSAQPDATAGQVVEGLRVTPVTAALRTRYSIAEGVEGLVITSVSSEARAARIGFEPGMVIMQANGSAVRTPAEFAAAVQAVRQANRPGIFLLVRIAAGNRPIVLPLSEAE